VYDRELAIDTLRGHLYKIGDQIWTAEKFGNEDERKNKAVHHFTEFLKISKQTKTLFKGEKAQIIDNLEKKTIALVKASKKLNYLRPVTS
jgi:hypothetical protein